MRAGKLRHTVELQRPVTTLDDAGQEVLTWETFKKLKAEIKPTAGSEAWNANTVEAFESRTIRIRYTPNLTTQHRIRVCTTGKIYSIRAILNWEERNRELLINTVEYRDQGTY